MISLKVGQATRTYEIAEELAAGPVLAADMSARGWEPVSYILRQTSGRHAGKACVLAYRNATTGSFELVTR